MVTIAKVLSWLDGVASSPSEKLKKNRLRERLRMLRRLAGKPV